MELPIFALLLSLLPVFVTEDGQSIVSFLEARHSLRAVEEQFDLGGDSFRQPLEIDEKGEWVIHKQVVWPVDFTLWKENVLVKLDLVPFFLGHFSLLESGQWHFLIEKLYKHH